MTEANRQILDLARDGLSVREISECLGYTEEAVTIVVQQNVNKAAPRDSNVDEVEARFASMQAKSLNTIEWLMDHADDEHLRAKLAMYVADQRLGLKKAARPGNVINITLLENQIRKAKALVSDEVIDVTPREQLQLAGAA